MSRCKKPEIKKLFHAYELGLLGEDQIQELELHLLECEECFGELKSFENEALSLKQSQKIKEHVYELTESKKSDEATGFKLKRLLIPLVAAAIIIFMLISPWQIDIKTGDDVQAIDNQILVAPFDMTDTSTDTPDMGRVLSNLIINKFNSETSVRALTDQRMYEITKILSGKMAVKPSALEKAQFAKTKWLLRGSLTIDSLLNLKAQLIDVVSGNVKEVIDLSSLSENGVFELSDQVTKVLKPVIMPDFDRTETVSSGEGKVYTHSEKAYAAYLNGLDNYRKYYYREALKDFEQALKLDSNFAMVYYYLSLLKDNNLIYKAVEYSQSVNYSDSIYIESRRMLYEGKSDSIVVILSKLIKKYPDEKLAYYHLGMEYFRQAEFEKAVEVLEKAKKLDPFYKQTFNILAFCYTMLDDYDNAIIAIDGYINLAGDEANPYDSKGTIHAAFGQLDKAISAYKKALEVKPDFYSSLMYLSYMYLYKGEYLKFDSCNGILLNCDLKRMRESARMYAAYHPVRLGQFNKSIELLNDNIEFDRSNKSHVLGICYKYFLKATIFDGLNNLDSAMSAIKECITISEENEPGDNLEFRNYEMYLLMKQGRIEEAQKVLASLIVDLDSNHDTYFTYWFNLGLKAYYQKSYFKAAEYFEKSKSKAIEKNAYGNYIGQFMAGLAYLEDNNFEKAIEKFEQLKKTYTSRRLFWSTWDIKLPYYLGLAYEQSNWKAKAKEQYQIFINSLNDSDFEFDFLQDAVKRHSTLDKK